MERKILVYYLKNLGSSLCMTISPKAVSLKKAISPNAILHNDHFA
jgi:hypothetical protein